MAVELKKPFNSDNSEVFLQKNKEYMEIIRGLKLIDDDFMSKVFEDIECTQLLLNIILDREDLTVCEVHPQFDIKNLQGRSVRLDILARDKDGLMYNVEVQRSDHGAGFKRARYNSSLLDANLTNPGDKYNALGETYVIFITEHDVVKAGLPIYHIDRIVRETGEVFNDGAHIIYVNAQHKSNTPLGKLMSDFACTDAENMNYPVLAERVKYFKEDAKGVANMCREIEKLAESRYAEGQAEGKAEARAETHAEALRTVMSKMHLELDEAMDFLDIPEADRAALKSIVVAMMADDKEA